jgi:hypothetical protein
VCWNEGINKGEEKKYNEGRAPTGSESAQGDKHNAKNGNIIYSHNIARAPSVNNNTGSRQQLQLQLRPQQHNYNTIIL